MTTIKCRYNRPVSAHLPSAGGPLCPRLSPFVLAFQQDNATWGFGVWMGWSLKARQKQRRRADAAFQASRGWAAGNGRGRVDVLAPGEGVVSLVRADPASTGMEPRAASPVKPAGLVRRIIPAALRFTRPRYGL